jgi:ATP-dependent Clp protease adapter protein ClpS
MSLHQPDRPADPPEPHGPSQPPEKQRGFPHYKLILHAGGSPDMMSVVRTIMELTHLCQAEATHKMWEAHHYGRSLLLVTYKERAELYAEQFSERGLTVTIERA